MDVIESRAEPVRKALAANRALLLDDSLASWQVDSGRVLLFAVELGPVEQADDGSPTVPHPTGQRHFLAALEAGDLLVGLEPRPGQLGILATGAGPASIRQVALEGLCLAAGAGDSGAAAAIEAWVRALSGRITARRALPDGLRILPEGVSELGAGAAARPFGGVRVVRAMTGLLSLTGVDAAAFGPEEAGVALSQEAWVAALDDSEITTTTLAGPEDVAASALRALTRLAMLSLADEVDSLAQLREHHTRKLADTDTESQLSAVEELATVLSARRRAVAQVGSRDAAIGVVQVVGHELGHEWPDDGLVLDPDLPAVERVRLAARQAGCRTRQVELPPRWWKNDSGPMIGYRADSGAPVALLRDWSGYRLVDPERRLQLPVDGSLAAELSVEATVLARPLHREAARVGQVVRLGVRRSGLDLSWMVVFGSFAGLASLVTPLLTGQIFNSIIPANERGRLVAAVVTLAVVALSVALGALARGISFVRVRARFSATASSALWDRLLQLPAGFFSQYQIGALSSRVRSLEMAQQILTDAIVATVLNGVFSLFNLFLFYVAGGTLFWVGLGLVTVQVAIVAISLLVQVGMARSQIAAMNRAQALSLQLVRGINKLRVAAAERRGFATWAHAFAAQSRAGYRTARAGIFMEVFNGSWSAITTFAVIGVVSAVGLGTVTVGSYIEFTTALAQVTTALIAMVTGLGTMAVVVPLLELPAPILEARVESGGGREQPGVLSGALEVSHVNFRYHPDGPLVLEEVSLEAEPGEFIAIVGPSGAGKSSLVRLLLGFEVPESGSVLYGGRDLQSLDTSAVRRQIGTVIQSARLLPGTVYSNIAGGLPVSRDEAWEAAEAAGIAADIRDMPMGMETVIVEGGGVVSGGQRQRILIARALARRPRILLFDEATSALDNLTQAIVTRSVSKLQVTRVVIAHRLSTVQDADRIYVLERGRLVQAGTYDELMAVDGVFLRLASRQLV